MISLLVKAGAIEYMLVDALLSAEPHMKFAKKIFNPEQYLHLTDAIMPIIEATNDPVINPFLNVLLVRFKTLIVYPGTCRSSCHIGSNPHPRSL